MSELQIPETDTPIPATAITDKVKAEYMAYGEKPYREDARVLGQMIARVNDAPEVNQDPYIGMAGGEYYQETLENTRQKAIETAEYAGVAAGKAYDQYVEAQKDAERVATEAQAKIDSAKQELDDLSR